MALVVKRPLAEADLEDLWWYIAQDNPSAADRFLEKIAESCRTLANFPEMGRSREELHPGLRSGQARGRAGTGAGRHGDGQARGRAGTGAGRHRGLPLRVFLPQPRWPGRSRKGDRSQVQLGSGMRKN